MFLETENLSFMQAKLPIHLDEMEELIAKNHEETGVYDLPFNPDRERYLGLWNSGDLAFFTVHHTKTLKLVGFALFFLDNEIQQKDVKSATQSLNFIEKEYRGAGYTFMKFCDDILKKQGVNSIWRQTSAKFDIGKIYERMGYELVEKSYLRRL
jgi:GNAT superfamily N-acetyltransferase